MTSLNNKRTREAARIRRRREALGLTRPQVAALAQVCLTSVANAESFGSPRTCGRITEALDKYERQQEQEAVR